VITHTPLPDEAAEDPGGAEGELAHVAGAVDEVDEIASEPIRGGDGHVLILPRERIEAQRAVDTDVRLCARSRLPPFGAFDVRCAGSVG
jgi:hypothetical protein